MQWDHPHKAEFASTRPLFPMGIMGKLDVLRKMPGVAFT